MSSNRLRTTLVLLLVVMLWDAKAQDLANISKQKPFDYNGSLSVNASFYTFSGNGSPRNDPFNWSVSGSPTLIFYGISFPFTFMFSSQDKSFTQPFNQYGLSPTYKWITIHAGYRSVSFSPFTLAGATFLGGGVELKPGIFRFAAIYGRFQKAIAEDTNRAETVPAYKRMGLGIKIGVGNSKNYVDLIVFHGEDNTGSIPEPQPNSSLKPQENLVIGLNGRVQIIKKISLQVEAAGSAYSLDTRAPEIEDSWTGALESIFKVRLSTQLLTAFQAALAYNEKIFTIKLQYKRIDPDYKSMGAYHFQSDVESFTLEPSFRLFKQKLRIGGSIGLQHDNLLDQKLATTKRTIGSANLSYNPGQIYGLDITFSNYGIVQKAGTRPVNDTTKIAQANLNFNIVNRLTFANKVRVMNFMLLVSYQQLNDLNQFSSDYTENQVVFGNLNFAYTMLSNGMSVNAGLNVTNSTTAAFSSFLIGPSAGISMEIIKKKLSGTANASYQLCRTNSSSSGSIMNAAMGFSYRPHKKHSFNLNITMIHNSSDAVPNGTFTEFRFNAGYQFRLK